MSLAPRRNTLSAAAWLAGLAVMAGAQYAIRQDPSNIAATVVEVAAALVVAVLLGRATPQESGASPAPALARGRRRWLGVVGIIAGVVLIGSGVIALVADWSRTFIWGWATLIAGTAVLAAGLSALDATPDPRPGWSWIEVVIVVACVALGTWLRFHRYADFPEPFSTHAIEEQQAGLAAHDILTKGARPWEFMLDYHLAALALWMSGDPSFLTIRIPFTIASALTILPVHLLLRRLVAVPAALAGTFLYSVMSWNLLYSRCAHNIFLTNGLVIIALILLVQFAQTRRLAALPWIGLLSGYTLYSYAGYRGTPLFALGYIGWLLATDGWRWWRGRANATVATMRSMVRRDVLAIGIVTVGVVVVAAPMFALLNADTSNPYYYFEAGSRALANKQYYTGDTGAFIAQRVQRVRDTAAIFMHVGDGALTFNQPGAPMLDPVTAVCFLAGLCLAVCYPRRGLNGLWLVMFVTLMLVGTVFVQNLDIRRLQGITVLVVIFAALFLDRAWSAIETMPVAALRFVVLIAGLAAVGVFWWSYHLYFEQMARNPRVREAFKNQYTTLIRYGRERGRAQGDRDPYLVLLSPLRRFFDPEFYYGSHYAWLRDGFMRGKDLGDMTEVLPPQVPPANQGRVSVVIQEPYERVALAALLAEVYPGTRCAEFVDPDIRRASLTICDLPETVAGRRLLPHLHARYWLGKPGNDTPSGAPFLERDEPFIGFALVPDRCYDVQLGAHCLAEWTGTLQLETAGNYQFRTAVRGPSKIQVWIDGVAVGDAPIHLGGGPHTFRAAGQLARELESGARLLWLHDGQETLVPFYTVGDDGPLDKR